MSTIYGEGYVADMLNVTQTAEGPIPHLNKNGIEMPVALMIHPKSPISLLDQPQRPMRTADGDLIFVAPGGGRVTA